MTKHADKEKVFEICKNYFAKHGFMPDTAELCKMSGYTAKSTITGVLNELEKDGRIKILRTKKGVMCPRAYVIVGMKVRFTK